MAPNVVLGSSKSSTYPRGYACGFDLPAALLDDHFHKPAEVNLVEAYILTFEILTYQYSFPQPANDIQSAIASRHFLNCFPLILVR